MGDRSRERAQQHRDMLLLNESFCGRDSGFRIRRVVAVEGLYRPAQHSAGLIDTLKRKFDAILFALPAIGELSAEYCGDADANRLRREGWTEAHQTSDQEYRPESHRFYPMNGGSELAAGLTWTSCLIPFRQAIGASDRNAIVTTCSDAVSSSSDRASQLDQRSATPRRVAGVLNPENHPRRAAQ